MNTTSEKGKKRFREMYAISISMVEKVSEIVGARVKERIFKAAERDIIANFEKGGEGQLEE